jgi:NAD-dependent SIR2 family protein deacetylase
MAPRTSIAEFRELVDSSNRILALCGAGLSAASGLPTFRGAGGLWRNHESTSLATPDAFEADPALVWLFYAWRKHMALKANPNLGHYALAELAKKKENFLCLTQNVDGEWTVYAVEADECQTNVVRPPTYEESASNRRS